MSYEFGPFRYDPGQRLLFRGTGLVPLVPKALDTLHVLLERRGAIVEKSDLMKLVWPDTTVEEVGLARNISLLRKALGDEDAGSQYIETIPRRGYRFVGPVSIPESAALPTTIPGAEAAPPSATPRLGWILRRWWIPLGALFAVALVYYQFYTPSRYLPGSRAAGLAVVPFDCLCPGMDGESFSQGLDEVLVARLSQLDGVQVVSPSTVRRHRRLGVSMGLMGRLLALDVLAEGTIQKLDDRLRITARLVDVHTGRIIWADTYDQRADDPAAAQDAVAIAVTVEARKRFTAEESIPRFQPKTSTSSKPQ